MIPKKIHYVWFGGKEKPNDILRCMETWSKHLEDFEIIEWNETNFDVNSHPYTKKAYEEGKFAYVSDFVRAYALHNYGGIYLDTDVIVLEDLSSLLSDDAFVGFENPKYPFTAVFGCVPHHILTGKILKMYDNLSFQYDNTDEYKHTNTRTVSDILINDFNVKVNNEEQVVKGNTRIYPDYILCNPSGDSKTIHVFTGTWIEKAKPLKRKLVKFLKLRLTTKRRSEIYSRVVK